MSDAVLSTFPLGFPWKTSDPFLFCVHHDDQYPKGNENLGPAASLDGREIGQDFEGRDGWRMYHGDVVPGFPQHPHRGFETITIVRRGLCDHSDSLGAAARFGEGDVQWLTAGAGIVHSEMFPLLKRDQANPLELFQIWLNLPSSDKLVPPHFSMLWNSDIPRLPFEDERGKRTEVSVIAGELAGRRAPPPPPHSWAARPDSHVAIFSIRLQPGAHWTLPAAAAPEARRNLFVFAGRGLLVDGRSIDSGTGASLRGDAAVSLEAGETECEALLLQGRPIAEPVAQYGPFVMNSRSELQQAFVDFQTTGFGGWPWPSNGPTHGTTEGRFARHEDGRVEKAPT